ncbi:hypothetical protein Belba_2850 [Belliella baltica DSM 15883]|uniref:Uncharacterized protein n=1 Tax=Belliella baltica (strain DSM 15883 / CIP 108006 / LMG 21964 / BA134) TaxID=866536 RepID=I3Z814_BELBD|nr:hypothetical protein [Belliella baltica]AFL85382.1 hypothetical protein Belba_2850 [Belliella baltica DSM 15883]
MKKSEFAFLFLFVLFGVQALALNTVSKNETEVCPLESSESAIFFLIKSEIKSELGRVETFVPAVNSFSFLSKNRIDSQGLGIVNPDHRETILQNFYSGVIDSFSLAVSSILDFLHPYLFFY